MKRIRVSNSHFPATQLVYNASQPAPRLVSRRTDRPSWYFPYISLMILATAALGASASQAFGFLFDAHPFAGISRNAALGRGTELCQALTNSPAQAVSVEGISTIESKTGLPHNEWEITCRDANASYLLKIDARRDRLIHFQKEPPPNGAASAGTVRSEIGDCPPINRAAAIEVGRHYLIATGLAAGTPQMVAESVTKTSNGRLWNIVCIYTDAQGGRQKARIAVVCKDGSLDNILSL